MSLEKFNIEAMYASYPRGERDAFYVADASCLVEYKGMGYNLNIPQDGERRVPSGVWKWETIPVKDTRGLVKSVCKSHHMAYRLFFHRFGFLQQHYFKRLLQHFSTSRKSCLHREVTSHIHSNSSALGVSKAWSWCIMMAPKSDLKSMHFRSKNHRFHLFLVSLKMDGIERLLGHERLFKWMQYRTSQIMWFLPYPLIFLYLVVY